MTLKQKAKFWEGMAWELAGYIAGSWNLNAIDEMPCDCVDGTCEHGGDETLCVLEAFRRQLADRIPVPERIEI